MNHIQYSEEMKRLEQKVLDAAENMVCNPTPGKDFGNLLNDFAVIVREYVIFKNSVK
jgi:hypothetical protein